MSRGGRILVVDDEVGMLRAVGRVLAPEYTVLCLDSPDEALARAAEFDPELALLDVRMPSMTGFELLDRLRERRLDFDVILMTGSVGETDATHVQALQRKAFYFIQKPFDRRVLLALVERCLDLRRLEADNKRYVERLESELAEARTFQQSLLPPAQAAIGRVALAARNIPSAELGGDFYDYADAGNGRVALLIADVAGHGASAAMLTGIVKSAFDSSRSEEWHPAGVLRRVADGIRNFDARRFVTLLCARLDPSAGSLEWVNAGHPAGILWDASGRESLLEPTGLIVSPVFADRWWQVQTAPLAPGARLLLYTDGLVELERDGVALGTEALHECIRRRPEGGVALLDDIESTAAAYARLPANDDVTMLTMTWIE